MYHSEVGFSSLTVSKMVESELTDYYKCGCWYTRSYDEDGLCMIRAQVCSNCFDQFHDALEKLTLDERSQLTLDLPSTEGDRRRGQSNDRAKTAS